MKKILVLLDLYLYFDKVLKIFEKEKLDIVIGVGDGIKDIEELFYVYLKVKYYMVKGNCDFFDRSYNEENFFEIDGIKVFLIYGYFYDVKWILNFIKEIGKKLNVFFIVFGYIYKLYIEKDGNMILFNLGVIKDGRYGIIILE